MRIQNTVKKIRQSIGERIERLKTLTFFAKHSTLDVWQGSEHASVYLFVFSPITVKSSPTNFFMPLFNGWKHFMKASTSKDTSDSAFFAVEIFYENLVSNALALAFSKVSDSLVYVELFTLVEETG